MPLVTLKKPSRSDLKRVVQAQRGLPVTYSGDVEPTPGFRYTKTVKPLGSGVDLFEGAVAGLEAWAVYPAWMTLYPASAPLKEGTCVALATGVGPVWTVNTVRVVAVLRTPRRLSFTLGTLPQHALSGLERFSVSLENSQVWYEIAALSKPRHPLAELGAPGVRLVQARFAKDSVASLREFVERAELGLLAAPDSGGYRL